MVYGDVRVVRGRRVKCRWERGEVGVWFNYYVTLGIMVNKYHITHMTSW